MSARTEAHTIISCDGDECRTPPMTAVMKAAEMRRHLARQGWTRRPKGDHHVDLCPKCSPSYEPPEGTHKGGRPKKVKARG